MSFPSFLKILTKFVNVLAWPSVCLVFPLFASIWAIEGDKPFSYQQCLTYWVLFAITKIMESALGKLLGWLPFWSHAKGIATLFMVIPHFGGASYVYLHFIRPCIFANSHVSQVYDKPIIPSTECFTSSEHSNSREAGENYIEEIGIEESKTAIINEDDSSHACDHIESHLIQLTGPKKIRKEWSCAICQINTTSEKCLKKHLAGKKHKAVEDELRRNKLVKKDPVKSSLTMKIERWSSLLRPVATSVTWCTWRKPDHGWTKLNTDGSIDRENAGFGGLLRDHAGYPLCAYVSNVPKALGDDIFLVELWAIWRGLVLALGLGIKVIWVESDSMSVVKSINREQPCGPRAFRPMKHIWELLKKFEKYQVSHSWRETNRAADYLAKMCLLGSDVVLYPDDFPPKLWNIIKDDAQGRKYRRL